MIECEVLKKLGPHKPGDKIMMHDRDAAMYDAAGTVKALGELPPPVEPAPAEEPAADVEENPDAE